MILSSATKYGIGRFKFDEYPPWCKNRIKKINRRQRQRWKKERFVPKHALIVVWHLGIKFVDSLPNQGIRLENFLDLLWELASSGEDNEETETALFFYMDIVNSEIMNLNFGKMGIRLRGRRSFLID